MDIAASRRNRCATMSSIGSEATGAWLRRHAIAEDVGRTLRFARGLLAHVLRSENLHHRHAPRAARGEPNASTRSRSKAEHVELRRTPPPGALIVWCVARSGPHRAFARKKPK